MIEIHTVLSFSTAFTSSRVSRNKSCTRLCNVLQDGSLKSALKLRQKAAMQGCSRTLYARLLRTCSSARHISAVRCFSAPKEPSADRCSVCWVNILSDGVDRLVRALAALCSAIELLGHALRTSVCAFWNCSQIAASCSADIWPSPTSPGDRPSGCSARPAAPTSYRTGCPPWGAVKQRETWEIIGGCGN